MKKITKIKKKSTLHPSIEEKEIAEQNYVDNQTLEQPSDPQYPFDEPEHLNVDEKKEASDFEE